MPPSLSSADVFLPDGKGGILLPQDDRRVAAVSIEFIQSLHFALVDQFADNAADVLYRSGYEWGLQDMIGLNRNFRAEFGNTTDLWQSDAKFVLDTWWTRLAGGGWGAWSLDLSALAGGLVVVELKNSPIAAALGRADDPVCHLYAGLFAGALSFFERTERHAVEVQCRALGHPSCQFVVASGPRIDSAEGWRQQGASAAEIIRRLA